MPTSYSHRRELWLRQTEQWPKSLREKVTVRNIKAVTRLSPRARETMAAALDHGLESIPAAIRYLKDHPDAVADELVQMCRRTRTPQGQSGGAGDSVAQTGVAVDSAGRTGVTVNHAGLSNQPNDPPSRSADPGDIAALADLYQYAHPGAYRIVAEAWAEDPKWAGLRDLVHAWRAHLATPTGTPHSETVIVVSRAFLVKACEQLNLLIAERPAYQQALKMSGVPNG